MPKVSVVMPVYNASRFLNESVESILNQTLSDLELICVDDGSTDDSADILNDYAGKDSRVKVFFLPHEGGGNARNYGLGKITGEYLFCMDADDTLDLNAFEDFYNIAEEKNLDFLTFKAINYGVEKDHFFETDYQNMQPIYAKVHDNVFSFKDLGDTIFDFNVSPWCKFYNAEFIKSTGARFRENSKFHDNQFFWDIIFQAERIYFIDKFYYTRKRYDDSLTASGDRNHINIIGVVNDIIKLFEKHEQLENYKNKLYNIKIMWIIDRYNQIQVEFKEEFFNEMKKDFEKTSEEFEVELNDDYKFILYNVKISSTYKEFDLMNELYSKKIKSLSKQIQDYITQNKQLKNEINNIKSKNILLEKENIELNKNIFNKIYSKIIK